MWLQCDDCMKWRGIPRHLFKNNLPEHFTCSQHPIGRLRSCLVPEEPEEPEDELTPSYEKTHKKHEVWAKRRGKSLESDKVPTPPECKETPKPTSEATPDETVITIETETESKDDESTPSQYHCNKRKATWTNEEISNKSPKRTDSEKEISTTTNESEEQAMEENLEILEAKSNDQTVKNANDEAKSTVVSPEAESTNPTPSEQQVSRAAQTKEQPKPATGPQGRPHPITPHTSMAWSHPLPPTQTVVVPPLSRTSRQPHTVLRLENPDRSVLTSRLDQLEREAKRLRRILGLREAVVQMSPLSDGEVSGSTGTVQDGKTDSGTSIEADATASVTSQKSGPHPDQRSILKSAISPAGQQETLVTLADDLQWSKTLAKLQSQNQALCTELNNVKTENDELQSKLRQTERETRDKREQSTNTPSSIHDSIALDRLRSIRRNVVSLLSSILPNLDMQGISYDTGDVDSILQQIIQANNL
ncbi:MORC family CW-type zinc finger protein 3 isoform X1 [Tachysurus ichikawai]